ncbi:hypothetical protein [Scytonema sp. PCC 10023]|uniref:hypothetical protein n=1 Tax=Scytonema sp. PCC 10023 TaxID=1680591 RepID=UPI0039C63A91
MIIGKLSLPPLLAQQPLEPHFQVKAGKLKASRVAAEIEGYSPVAAAHLEQHKYLPGIKLLGKIDFL